MDFTVFVSFIKIKITFTIKTRFHIGVLTSLGVVVVCVEAVGGGCCEKE